MSSPEVPWGGSSSDSSAKGNTSRDTNTNHKTNQDRTQNAYPQSFYGAMIARYQADNTIGPDEFNAFHDRTAPFPQGPPSQRAQAPSQIGHNVLTPPYYQEYRHTLDWAPPSSQSSDMMNVPTNHDYNFATRFAPLQREKPKLDQAIKVGDLENFTKSSTLEPNSEMPKNVHTDSASAKTAASKAQQTVAPTYLASYESTHPHLMTEPKVIQDSTTPPLKFSDYSGEPHKKWVAKAEANAKCDHCHKTPMLDPDHQTLIQRCLKCNLQLCMMCFVEYGVDAKHPPTDQLEWSPTRQQKNKARKSAPREKQQSPSPAPGRRAGQRKVQRGSAQAAKAKLVEEEDDDAAEIEEKLLLKTAKKPIVPAKRKAQENKKVVKDVKAVKSRKIDTAGFAASPLSDFNMEMDVDDFSGDSHHEVDSDYKESDQPTRPTIFDEIPTRTGRRTARTPSLPIAGTRKRADSKVKLPVSVRKFPQWAIVSRVYRELHGDQEAPYASSFKSNDKEGISKELADEMVKAWENNADLKELKKAGKEEEAREVLKAARTLCLMQAGTIPMMK